MRLLLDTCTFLWAAAEPARLSERVHQTLGEPGHEILLHWRRDEVACEVEIRDRGVPLPAQLLQDAEQAELDAEGGRGWYIIQQWADEVSYARDGDDNVLSLRQRL